MRPDGSGFIKKLHDIPARSQLSPVKIIYPKPSFAAEFTPTLKQLIAPQELQIKEQLRPVAELRYIPGATLIHIGGTGVGVAVGSGVLVGGGTGVFVGIGVLVGGGTGVSVGADVGKIGGVAVGADVGKIGGVAVGTDVGGGITTLQHNCPGGQVWDPKDPMHTPEELTQ
jgi:hypothetical protein